MNLIKCTKNCKYQSDGFCCYDECGEVKCISGGCPYYEKNPLPETNFFQTTDKYSTSNGIAFDTDGNRQGRHNPRFRL